MINYRDSDSTLVITADPQLAEAVIQGLAGYGFLAIIPITSGFENIVRLIENTHTRCVFIDSVLEYPGTTLSLCESLQTAGVHCIGINPMLDSQPRCRHHFKMFPVFPKERVHDELRSFFMAS